MLNYYLLSYKIRDFYLLVSTILLLYTNNINGQCAGTDNTVTICDKELDATLQNYELFIQLGGTPTAGGTWSTSDPLNRGFLDPITGEVNLWGINRFGIHSFTYTNTSCNESATVTINLGGYPGEDNIDGGANACGDNSSVNMFSFLDNVSSGLSVDRNGIWTETTIPTSGALSDFTFNASMVDPGIYTFTYTVGIVDTCSEEISNVVLEIHRNANPGTPIPLNLCESDDMSMYTNVNLHDRLIGEDSNGIWSDDNSTGQLSGSLDTTINIEEVYNTFGPGEYSYTYTVFPSHPVCEDRTSTVIIFIEEEYTLSGTASIFDVCINDPISMNVSYSILSLPNDSQPTTEYSESYEIAYQVYDSNNTLVDDLIVSEFVIEGGNFSLPIPEKLNSGLYSATITDLVNTDLTEFCDIVINVPSTTFLVQNPTITIHDICIGEDATFLLQNVLDNTGVLSNETVSIEYLITDPDINITNQNTGPISFVNGEASFIIDSSLLQNPNNETEYNIQIINPSNITLNCFSESFKVNPIPENIQLDLAVDNQCNAANMEVIVTAPTLGDGQYNVTYEVTEVNSSDVLIENSIIFIGGTANYSVDISSLEEGDYEVVLNSTQNDTTPCRTVFNFERTENFSIGGIPPPPELEAGQNFCFSDYNPSGPTISDIIVNSGDNLTWYADTITATPLAPSTLLIDGEDYYVTSTDPTNSCQSSERSVVVVSIISTAMVTTLEENPIFCSSDNATIANLNASTNGGTLIWYDSETGGNILEDSTPLINGNSYYAVENINGCESTVRLQINVTVITPPIPSLSGGSEFCGLDTPTLLDLEDRITPESGFNILWYDASQNGVALDLFDELQNGATYYASFLDPIYGCESEERLQVTIILSDCNPEEYGFFIPDGFSPNGDGRNDTYFIPNVEFFYPDFTLEIVNRYGQTLFKGNKNNPAWDGSNNKSGNDTTNGVYFYILNYNKDNLKPRQGKLYLSK